MAQLRCPICEQLFDSEKSKAMPFCSERCQKIDLGRWLRESYGIPVERSGEEDEADYSQRDE